MHVCVYVCVCVCARVYTCVFVHVCVCIHTCMCDAIIELCTINVVTPLAAISIPYTRKLYRNSIDVFLYIANSTNSMHA